MPEPTSWRPLRPWWNPNVPQERVEQLLEEARLARLAAKAAANDTAGQRAA